VDNVLILGRGKYGKSSLAESLCAEYVAQGLTPIVLDPIGIEHKWEGARVTKEPKEFLAWFWAARDTPAFVEEYALVTKRVPGKDWLEPEFVLTATTGRNQIGPEARGNWTHYSCHRLTQLDVTLRDQCSELYLFACRDDDAYQLSLDYGRPVLRQAPALNKLEYLFVSPDTKEVTLWEVDPESLETRRIQRKLRPEA